LDNWDPAVTDSLAAGRDVILFDNAGIGRSTGRVPDTVQEMASHALAFLDGLAVTICDVLGFSLGGMVTQQIALERPSMFRRMILVGYRPKRGTGHHAPRETDARRAVSRSRAARICEAPENLLRANRVESGRGSGVRRAAGSARRRSRSTVRTQVVVAQIAAFRDWERFSDERFADLRTIRQPTLVVNGVHDEMIAVTNFYALGEHLPNAVLLTYPDAGHGSLFQFHEAFTRQAAAFLASDSAFAPY
jgi:pimeloyl-ACP methyl ester carboxylesterase